MKRLIQGALLVVMIVSGGATARAQSDTLVVRRDTIDISRGVVGVSADTVSVSVDTASLFDAPPRLLPEDYFKYLSGDDAAPVQAAVKKPTSADVVAEGMDQMLSYNFPRALELFREAAASSEDPAIQKRIEEAGNAMTMSEMCSVVTPVSKAAFPVSDFFLFYPMAPASWRPCPNPLDPAGSFPVSATYLPQGAGSVYYSTATATGERNIYFSEDQDSLWTAPRLLDERLTTSGNEIFPVLSNDGKRLYFASDGLYGMGGYDLYYSDWDDRAGRWGEPVNMGFPYSSPADDFLLMDTRDGKYTIFASNRECSRDSVYVYVLEYKELPERKTISDPERLKTLSTLSPVTDPTRIDAGSAVRGAIPRNDEMRLYSETSSRISSLRDSVYLVESSIDALRASLSSAGDPGAVSKEIEEKHSELQPLKDSLSAAEERLKVIEASFLHKGTGAGRGRLKRTADREVVGAGSAYTFSKNSFGSKLKMKFPSPAVTAAASEFKISPVGRFAVDKALPEGIVYQIHIFTKSSHATLDDIAGLSPVYERLTRSLKYSCSVGVFRTYSAALEQLNAVRALGFADAYIEAYMDGREISLDAAISGTR